MVNDQEPRYRLVDADGNVVGSLFAESDGTLKLQEGTSGNDNGLSLTTQGALNVEQLSAKSIDGVGVHASEFASLQDAVDNVGNNGTVLVDSSFSENVTISNDGVRLLATGVEEDVTKINGTLTVNGQDCTVNGITLDPSSGLALDIDSFQSTVIDCVLRADVEIGPTDFHKVALNDFKGNTATLVSNTSASVVSLNTNVSITDNGNGNVTTSNA